MAGSLHRYFPISISVLSASLLAFVLIVPGRAQQAGSKADTSKQNKKYERATDPSLYVGSETCKTCHEDMLQGLLGEDAALENDARHQEAARSPGMRRLPRSRRGARRRRRRHDQDFHLQGCTRPRKSTNAACTCHAGGPQHMNAINSVHTKNDVSCISCHSPHHAKTSRIPAGQSPARALLHLPPAAKGPVRHALPSSRQRRAGAVQRLPQRARTVRPKQVRTSSTQDAVCFKCHTDKQGPFVYEHRTVKVDGCVVLPHGARRAKSPHAEAQQRQPALPAVPHDVEFQQRAGCSFVPQPGELFPGVHVVPRRRFTARISAPRSSSRAAMEVPMQRQPQIGERRSPEQAIRSRKAGEAMNESPGELLAIRCLVYSLCCFASRPLSRAQRTPTESKGSIPAITTSSRPSNSDTG